MARFGSKSPLKSFIFSKFTLVLLIGVAGMLAMSVYERYTVEREMAGRLEATETEYSSLQERRNGLLEKVEYLEGESGIESEIRKLFDVAREGEQVVIIVDDEVAPDPQLAPLEQNNQVAEPWWKFW